MTNTPLAVIAAVVALAAAPSARALAPTPPRATGGASCMALGYMTHHDSYYDILDVDGDRMSLRALLEAPAARRGAPPAPEPVQEEEVPAVSTSSSSSRSSRIRATSSGSRASRRTPAVTELRSVHDYQRHVLHAPNQLSIIRFSAPFCKTCRATAVSWERMAAKIQKSAMRCAGEQIKFLSVSVDGKDQETMALKDLLRVEKVPQGVLHHPARGVLGSKMDLNRANLAALRKRLESYVEEGAGGPLFDVPEFQL